MLKFENNYKKIMASSDEDLFETSDDDLSFENLKDVPLRLSLLSSTVNYQSTSSKINQKPNCGKMDRIEDLSLEYTSETDSDENHEIDESTNVIDGSEESLIKTESKTESDEQSDSDYEADEQSTKYDFGEEEEEFDIEQSKPNIKKELSNSESEDHNKSNENHNNTHQESEIRSNTSETDDSETEIPKVKRKAAFILNDTETSEAEEVIGVRSNISESEDSETEIPKVKRKAAFILNDTETSEAEDVIEDSGGSDETSGRNQSKRRTRIMLENEVSRSNSSIVYKPEVKIAEQKPKVNDTWRDTTVFEDSKEEKTSSNSSSKSDISVISVSEGEGGDNPIEVSSDESVQLVGFTRPSTGTPKAFRQLQIPEMINLQSPSVKSESTSEQFNVNQKYAEQFERVQKLQQQLFNAETVNQQFDLNSLPDRGALLLKRKAIIQEQLRREEAILKNLTPTNMKEPEPKRKFMETVSWKDLQAFSNQVQPGGLGGKQAMDTHMQQKTLTMDRLKSLHSSLKSRPGEDVIVAEPEGLKIELMPHQKHALAFLLWRETQKPAGGLLADDMGLGKTITMISLILKSRELEENNESTDKENESQKSDSDEENSPQPTRKRDLIPGGTLIICPAGLINQWEKEIQRRCKRDILSVELYHGQSRVTQPNKLARFDVVITTYNLVGKERDMGGRLNKINWNRIILDEAHVVRNYKSNMSIGVCNLRSKHRWCLTGTPIQNKEVDLYALLKFLKCHPFDDIQIWKKWIGNKTAGGQERLNTVVQSLMLRRTKQELQGQNEVFKLPNKEIKNIDVTLTKEETHVHQKFLVLSKTLFAQFLSQRAEKNVQQAMLPEELDRVYRKLTQIHGSTKVQAHQILLLILRLRQTCCHPGLIKVMLDSDAKNDEGIEDDQGNDIDLLEQIEKLNIEDDLNQSIKLNESNNLLDESLGTATTKVLNPRNPVFDFKFRSSKIALIIGTLKQNVIEQKEKAIIVSQWTSMLEIVEAHLKMEGIDSVTLSGSVPVQKRAMMVDSFNSPKNNLQVMLLSLTAGGVGLNLVGANHLMLIDLHWNPQLELQAQDRIYRLGQTKPVTIYKFVTLDTIEERIKRLQQKKLDMADSLLTGSAQSAGNKLTIDDMKMLFNMI